MTFQLNGAEGDPQINGNPAQEVQINGNTIWVRKETYEDFEDGSTALDSYTSTTYDPSGWASVTTTNALEGSYSLRGNKTSNDGPRIAIHDSITFSRGDSFSYLFEMNHTPYGGALQWAIPSTNVNQNDVEGYQVRADTDTGGGRFSICILDSGHESTNTLGYTEEPSITTGTTYRVEVDYSSTITASIYDTSGTLLGSCSATDSTYGSGYFGWFAIQNAATDEWWDYLHEP